jgi:hypothetical protein
MNYFCDLFDGLFVIVDKVDDFAVLPRHLGEAVVQLRGAVLVEGRPFRRVGWVLNELHKEIVELDNLASTLRQQGQRFVSRDR